MRIGSAKVDTSFLQSLKQDVNSVQSDVNKVQQDSSTKAGTDQLASQYNQSKYSVVASTEESSRSQSVSGEQKIEEVKTIERTIFRRDRGDQLDITV